MRTPVWTLKAIAAACGMLAMFTMVSPVAAESLQLNDSQKRVVLQEAQQAYDQATKTLAAQPADAKADFDLAARKFQQLIDAGCDNGRLRYDLGNAYLQSGQLGRAIGNYLRAEQQMGRTKRIETNLKIARARRDKQPVKSDADIVAMLRQWNAWLPLQSRFRNCVTLWGIFWIVLLFRIWTKRDWPLPRGLRWVLRIRYLFWPAAVGVVLLGCSVGWQWHEAAQVTRGVCCGNDVVIRQGNGQEFESAYEQRLSDGAEFRVLQQRGDWVEVELPDQRHGWVSADAVEVIPPIRLWS